LGESSQNAESFTHFAGTRNLDDLTVDEVTFFILCVFSSDRSIYKPPTPARDLIRGRVNSLSVTDNELMLQVAMAMSRTGHPVRAAPREAVQLLVRMTNRRDSSEDLVQEVFLRILKYGHSVPRRRRVCSLDVFNSPATRPTTLPEVEEGNAIGRCWDMPDQEPAPDDSLMHHEKSALLTKALALLSAEKREVLF